MTFPVVLAFAQELFGVLLAVVAVFLILLVLVQRGRGGGLAGALGGMGGSSAFGAKAGDVFTRITIVAAAIWIFLCIAATRWGGEMGSRVNVTSSSGTSAGASVAEEVEKGAASKDAGATNAEDAKGAAEAKADAAAETPAAEAPAAEASDAPATTEAPAAGEGATAEDAESSAK